MNLFKREKTLAELEEEREKIDAENSVAEAQLSLYQKRVAIAELKKRGLTPKYFGFDWKRILNFLNSTGASLSGQKKEVR